MANRTYRPTCSVIGRSCILLAILRSNFQVISPQFTLGVHSIQLRKPAASFEAIPAETSLVLATFVDYRVRLDVGALFVLLSDVQLILPRAISTVFWLRVFPL